MVFSVLKNVKKTYAWVSALIALVFVFLLCQGHSWVKLAFFVLQMQVYGSEECKNYYWFGATGFICAQAPMVWPTVGFALLLQTSTQCKTSNNANALDLIRCLGTPRGPWTTLQESLFYFIFMPLPLKWATRLPGLWYFCPCACKLCEYRVLHIAIFLLPGTVSGTQWASI